MSALTKIFIVLHVIVSLLLAAGIIVYVNQRENFKLAAETAKSQLADEKRVSAEWKNRVPLVEAAAAARLVEKDNQIATLNTAVQTAQGSITQRDSQLAELQQNLVQANASGVSANEALKVAQGQLKTQADNLTAVLATNDKLQKQNVESSNRISELTNALDVTTRHDRYMGEQNTQLAQQIASANELLRKYNISPTGTTLPPGGALNTTPAVNINGVVRDFKNINGVPYATISLGSAEAVTRGMQFKVVDPTRNQFLGYLTVDTVQVHEATGRLDGPAVNQVRPTSVKCVRSSNRVKLSIRPQT